MMGVVVGRVLEYIGEGGCGRKNYDVPNLQVDVRQIRHVLINLGNGAGGWL